MLAMGRALMSRPRMLLLDEPSMGLAPLMVQKVFETVLAVSGEGVTILLIEQNAKLALEVSHRGYVMESGEITLQGDSKALLHDDKVRAAYLGVGRSGSPGASFANDGTGADGPFPRVRLVRRGDAPVEARPGDARADRGDHDPVAVRARAVARRRRARVEDRRAAYRVRMLYGAHAAAHGDRRASRTRSPRSVAPAGASARSSSPRR
jgi:ABC-type sulfate/molybdate transport systems ATPase subunit